MTRGEAVRRIDDALGFRQTGHDRTSTIVLRLQEAQRDLEKGKTLPKFLLQEDQTISLLSGEHEVALPTGFIRVDDDNGLYWINDNSHLRTYLKAFHNYRDAVASQLTQQRPDQPAVQTMVPGAYVIRKSTIDFIVFADRDYEFVWNYYKAGTLLTSDIENEWLLYAPEWLIGEAGYRTALDLRDQGAMQIFDDMRTRARQAIFYDELVDMDALGPYQMGVGN